MRHETFAGPATIAVPDLHVLNDNPLTCPEGQPREEHRLQPQLAGYGTHEGASEHTFIVHGDTILPPQSSIRDGRGVRRQHR